ncbi:hypothetical protein WKN36_002245 [Escherichia coli]
MMHFQLAGSGVMSAFYPHESELSRRVKQLIRAAKKQLEALCAMKSHQSPDASCCTEQSSNSQIYW